MDREHDFLQNPVAETRVESKPPKLRTFSDFEIRLYKQCSYQPTEHMRLPIRELY